ncbi:hypothetical protein AQUCO_04900036v1 [Aquilegia coerulea]|uniref:Cwf19-like C-terminal domain-containing protein n=1 Tax=Aquilegia coerulea TaxID=218851 RepID=A0A2G5CJM5_AQUCA|nr:hypothetical protein AQUCO_04900036v1 [Aquilegia coerulea]PIA31459.1 hypothetical protein AQUCO_04900036v1 [Aquilegia coerulea]
MLSGVKFIPRDQLNIDLDSSPENGKKLGGRKDKSRRKKKSLKYDSSEDEGSEKIKKSSKSKEKWYSSDECSSSNSENEIDSDIDGKKRHSKRKEKKNHKLKKGGKRRKKHDSESYSSSEDGSIKGERDKRESERKEMGLDWMLKPASNPTRLPAKIDDPLEEPQVEEVKKPNPREMNPYLKGDGSGYPEDVELTKSGGVQLPSSSVVGDGGASWRLKALKRAQEQAAREGRNLKEVAEERWGSLGQLTVSAASSRAAPAHAHLHAIKDRRRGIAEKNQGVSDNKVNQNDETPYGGRGGYLKDVSLRHPDMKTPKVNDSLSWRKRKEQNISKGDTELISAAASCLNKFTNDGSFMRDINSHQSKDVDRSFHTKLEESKPLKLNFDEPIGVSSDQPPLSANQLAAKAMQLRLKGKHEEAEMLLKQAEIVKMKLEGGENIAYQESRSASRYAIRDISVRQKKKEEDADMHLAQKIAQNKLYSVSGQADDEYDFGDGPSKKKNRRSGGSEQLRDKRNIATHILTQQERCQYCFENPTRPRHLVVSIANFTYLMLPQWQPLVQGHCCILPMQHEAATRNIDDNVWDEIRNFKKCLIMMFAKQEKEVVFLETVVGLSQQRRHCLVECVPLPRELAREAPLYFKKAIDEAEEEWSQHNSKKLTDTSTKGLRGSIPKNFPYFHVEFGLDKGFVHVIDDEKQFNTNLGLNVIRGMLELPEEDMYRRRKHESVEAQKKAVVSFAQEWEPFDWTKALD